MREGRESRQKKSKSKETHLLRFTSSLLSGRDVQDGVGINIEGNFDLRNSTRSRWDSRELELSEQVVVLGAGTFSFEDLNEYSWLVVGVGREDFGLFGWDSGVSLDERSEDSTGGLDSHG